ncbi:MULTISPECIES: Na+/H+ antiporter [unclassified Luteibacter]|uniref:Na+/H+ antiporter n=1 Tax=unclassified Luteibacter TaxID=2620188 RepID=UPI0008BB899B|nr:MULTISPECIES: Na+/H+ antiporter [unclassified Luteibacter]MDR6938004.1 CPA1 family monovalent cation:H+ antiporter [Luteibacter sp. 3190]SEP00051.1 monovalent cation:H+ antiporter, CPA1 family [Luteibacter sp. UNC138MFCol5.1]SEW20575.1 sodium/proton antiporter, CPA1 family [Luteibacter sp. 329MFSha]
MELVITILVLLLVVALSGALVRILPVRLPLPLLQIGLGALLARPFGMHVEFDPDLFFLLFIPPLLFADGWRIPKRELFLLRGPILALAVGLVFFTILGIGYFVHWMIPTVPLAVAFALAAVLSPTDAVAVSSITGRSPMPPRLMHILSGEALLNDASGLVALQFAIAAELTGHFSLLSATGDFAVTAFGGLLAGAFVSAVFGVVRRRLVRWSSEVDPASQVGLLLLLPFAAYLLAEHFGVSGILAAVAAGMTMNYTDMQKGTYVATRVQSVAVWSMVEFTFNGLIFLLLGLQLPGIVGNAKLDLAQAGGGELWYLAAYVVAITFALVILRFVWVWISLRFVLLRAWHRGEQRPKVGTRLMWTTSLAGVRGAITLAGVLSLPLMKSTDVPFPTRDLMIFLATGVILCTLAFGAIGLPLSVRKLNLPGEDPRVREERMARALAAEAALRGIADEQKKVEADGDENAIALASRVAARVLGDYQQRLEAAGEEGDVPEKARAEAGTERAMRLAALRAERRELFELRRSHRINDETLRTLVREVDLAEAALTGLHSE